MRLKRLPMLVVGCTLSVGCRAASEVEAPGQRWWTDVTELASDRMEGRTTGSEALSVGGSVCRWPVRTPQAATGWDDSIFSAC
jgi:hypothetical protein